MEPVPTTLYHLDGFRDDISRGKRLYRSDDRVYESRDISGAAARIYEDRRGWRVKLRFPETDDAAAWEIYNDLVDRAPDDLDLERDQRSFHTALEQKGAVGVRDDGTSLRYNRDSQFSLPRSGLEASGGRVLTFSEYLTTLIGGGSSAGAILGGGLGFALGGPAGVVPGAMAGGGLGGLSGGIALPFVLQEHSWDGRYGSKSTLQKKKEGWADRVNGLRSRWARRKDAPDSDLLAAINRRNALQTILPESDDYKAGANAELDALEGKELDDTFTVLMDLHFYSFDELPGVTLSAPADTYREAVDTITTYLDRDTGPVEEPSLYTEPDAFRAMLSHLTYKDGGEQQLTEGGEALIANAMDRDDRPDDIDRFIDSRYTDHLQRIAFDR